MLYEQYESKIKKIATAKNWVNRYKILISSIIATIMLLTTGYLSTKGMIIEQIEIPSEFQYGNLVEFEKASAMFNDVFYEFSVEGSNVWSTEAPKTPGSYLVRAVSEGSLGNKRYSKPQKFSVKPTVADIKIDETKSVVYGEKPIVIANLLYNDHLDLDALTFSYSHEGLKTTATINLDSIKIYNSSNEDVTNFYIFEDKISSNYNSKQREITISAAEKTKIYDGESITYNVDDYNILKSSLAYDDILSITVKYYQDNVEIPAINVGEYTVKIDSYNISNNVDITNNYSVKLSDSKVKILKRPIKVKTLDLIGVYDGSEKYQTEYTVLSGIEGYYDLVEGHYLVPETKTVRVNAGTYENQVVYKVFDENDQEVTDNYDISYDYGQITIEARDIEISILDILDTTYNGLKVLYNTGLGNYELVGTKNFIGNDNIELSVIYKDSLGETISEAVNAGKYTVEIASHRFSETTIESNYNIVYKTISQEFNINKANLDVSLKTPNNDTYNGQAYTYFEGTNNFVFENGTTLYGNDKMSLVVKYLDENSKDIDQAINAGSYFVEVVGVEFLSGKDNYNEVNFINKVLPFEITPREILVSVKDIKDSQYNGNPITYLNELGNYVLEGTNDFIDEDDIKLNVVFKDINGNEVNPTNVGTYTVNIENHTFDEETISSNYDIKYNILSQEFNITPREIIVSVKDLKDIEYSGSPISYLDEFGNYVLEGTNDFIGEDDIKLNVVFKDVNDNEVNPTEVGKYTVHIVNYVYNNDSNSLNYTVAYKTEIKEFNITPREIIVSVKDILDREYNGEKVTYDNEFGNYVLESTNDFIDEDTIKLNVVFKDNNGLEVEPTNAGTYTVNIVDYTFNEGSNPSNYTIKYKEEFKEFTITPRVINVSLKDIKDSEYNGEKVTYNNEFGNYVLDGTNNFIGEDNIKLNVVFKDNNGLEVDPINAGTYTVNIIDHEFINESNSNNYDVKYIVQSKEFEITPRKILVSIKDILDREYNGEQVTYDNEFGNYILEGVNNFIGEDTIKLNVVYKDSNGEETLPTNVGTYTVNIVDHTFNNELSSSNYIVDYNVLSEEFTITPREIIVSIKDILDREYNGEKVTYYDTYGNYILDSINNFIGEDNIKLNVVFKDNNGLEVEPTNAGTYTVNIVDHTFNNELSSSNYSIKYKTKSEEFTITPRLVLVSVKDIENRQYNGDAITYSNVFGNYVLESKNTFIGDDNIKLNVIFKDINGSEVEPTEAGTYTVNIVDHTFNNELSSSNYDVKYKTETEEFTILQRVILVSVKDIKERQYNGEAITYSDVFGNYVLESTNYFIGDDNIKLSVVFKDINGNEINPTEAGKYTVNIIGYSFTEGTNSSNYDIQYKYDIKEFNITPREIEVSIKDIINREYNGNPITYYNEFGNYVLESTNYFIGDDNIQLSVVFKDSNGEEVTPINAGKYTVHIADYTFTEGTNVNNYDIKYVNETEEFEITPRQIKVSIKDIENKQYDGNKVTYSNEFGYYILESINNFINDDDIKLNVIFKDIEGNEVDPINVGKYTVHIAEYIFKEGTISTNYEITSFISSEEFEIIPREIKVSIKDIENKQYDGNTVTYSDTFGNYILDSINDFAVNEDIKLNVIFKDINGDEIVPTEAGTYTVNIKDYTFKDGTSADNYSISYGIESHTFTITPREITVSVKDILNRQYNNEPITYSDTFGNYVLNSSNGFIGNDNIKLNVVFKDINGDEVTPINAGTYTVNIVNHVFSEETNASNYTIKYQTISEEFTIEQRIIKVSVKDILDREYNGEEITYIDDFGNYVLESTNDFIGDYDIKLNVVFKNSQGNQIIPENAGTYTVELIDYEFNIEENSSNYKIETVITSHEFTITPRIIEVSVKDILDREYNGEEVTYLDEFGNYVLEGTNDFIHNDEDIKLFVSFENEHPINADTYKVKIVSYTFTEETNTNNYMISYVTDSHEFNILPREIKVSVRDILDREYNGETISYYNGPGNYVLDSLNDFIGDDNITLNVIYKDVDNQIANPINAGTYTVHADSYTFTEGTNVNNYKITINSKPEEFNINARKIVVSIKDMENTQYNGSEITYPDQFGYYILESANDFISSDDIKLNVIYKNSLGEIVTPVEVGIYTVYINGHTFTDNTITDNYDISYQTTSEVFTITQREITISVKDIFDREYNGEEITYYEGFGNYVLESINDFIDPDDITLNVVFKDSNGTVIEKPINAGTYTVEYVGYEFNNLDSESNYSIKTNITSHEFTIIPRAIKVSVKDIIDREYNGKEITYYKGFGNYVIEGTNNFINLDNIQISVRFENSKGETVEKPINADTYKVYITGYEFNEETIVSNYNITYDTDSQDTFTILKRTILVSVKDIIDKEYNGEKVTYYSGVGNYILEGANDFIFENEDIELLVKFKNSKGETIENPINAGTYTVNIDNYQFSDETNKSNYKIDYVVKSHEFSITPRVINVSTKDIEDKEYDGLSVLYPSEYDNYILESINDFIGTDNIKLEVYYINSKGVEELNPTNADTYKVYIRKYVFTEGTISTNYDVKYDKDVQDTFTITPRSIKVSINTPSQLTHVYNGNAEYEYELTKNNFIADRLLSIDTLYPVVKYLDKDGKEIKQNQMIDAQTYTIELLKVVCCLEEKCSCPQNYEITYENTSFEYVITPRQVTIDAINKDIIYSNENYIYPKNSVVLESGDFVNEHNVTIEVKYKVNGQIIDYLPINAGEYQIIVDSHKVIGTLNSNYEVTYDNDDYNRLIISPAKIYIKPVGFEETYNGNDHISNLKYKILTKDDFADANTLDEKHELIVNYEIYKSSESVNEIVNAGTYNIYINKDNYIINNTNRDNYQIIVKDQDEFETSVIINRRKVSISPIDQKDKPSYDGTPLTLLKGIKVVDGNFVKENEINELEFEFKVYKDDVEVNEWIDASTYEIRINQISNNLDENYDINFDTSVYVKINKVEVEVVIDTIDPKDYPTYNGQAYNPFINYGYEVKTILPNNEKLSITLMIFDENGNYCETYPTNIGKYFIRYVDNIDNYEITDGRANKDNYIIKQPILESMFEIKQRKIHLYTGSSTEVYNGNPLTNANYDYEDDTPYELADNHRFHLGEDLPSIIRVGDVDNKLPLVILDEKDKDVTSNYKIEWNYGKLIVTPRPITIMTASKTVEYQGQNNPFRYEIVEKYTLQDNELKVGLLEDKNHEIIVIENSSESITDVGTIKNKFIVKIIDSNIADLKEQIITDCYDISYEYGDLTITEKQISVSLIDEIYTYNKKDYFVNIIIDDHYSYEIPNITYKYVNVETNKEVENIIDAGKYKVSIDNYSVIYRNKDVTKNYKLCYIDEKTEALIEVEKINIEVITESKSFIFKNKEYSHPIYNEDSVKTKILPDDELILVKDFTTIVNIESKDNEVKFKVNYKGTDIENTNYNITYTYGTLSVSGGTYRVTPSGVYNGNVDEQQVIQTIKAFDEHGILIDGTYIELTIGTQIRNSNGNIITPTSSGMYFVKLYNLSIINLFDKDITDEQKEINFINSEIIVGDVVVKARGTKDLSTDVCPFEVIKRDIYLKPNNISRIYNGDPLYYTQENGVVELFTDSTMLLPGHRIEIDTKYNVHNPIYHLDENKTDNMITSVRIFNENDEDVTELYNPVFSSTNPTDNKQYQASISIERRTIYIKSHDASKDFDGTELYCKDYTIEARNGANEGIAGNDQITVEKYTSVDTVRRAKNKLKFNFTNENGIDVTNSYRVRLTEGTLEIKERELTISTSSDSKAYDGTALTKHEASFDGTNITSSKETSSFTIKIDETTQKTFKVVLEYTGTQKEVGISDNTISLSNIVIYDIDDILQTNIFEYFDISVNCGKLKVYTDLTIKTKDDTKNYDGSDLENHSAIFSGSKIKPISDNMFTLENSNTEYVIELIYTGKQKEIGSSKNTIDKQKIYIYINGDENQTDLSDCFTINVIEGTLTVTDGTDINPTSVTNLLNENDINYNLPLNNGEESNISNDFDINDVEPTAVN